MVAMSLRCVPTRYDTTTDVIVREQVLSQWQFSPSITPLSVFVAICFVWALRASCTMYGLSILWVWCCDARAELTVM